PPKLDPSLIGFGPRCSWRREPGQQQRHTPLGQWHLGPTRAVKENPLCLGLFAWPTGAEAPECTCERQVLPENPKLDLAGDVPALRATRVRECRGAVQT